MCDKEEKEMAINQHLEELQRKIRNLSKRTPVLNGEDHMVELDPDNPNHKEWYEKDKYIGEFNPTMSSPM